MRRVSHVPTPLFLRIGVLLALFIPSFAFGQTVVVTYVLGDVWLLPDITYPWDSTGQMIGCEGDSIADQVIDVNDISFVLFRLGMLCV